ncbi:MAG: hypothetical protein AAF565_19250 [Pseudomonadota bacterium]
MQHTKDGNIIGLDVTWQFPVAEWSPRERVEIDGLRAVLDEGNRALEWDGGVTDAGDPWIVAIDSFSGDMVVHLARIGRSYVALDGDLQPLASGHSLRAVLGSYLEQQRDVLSLAELARGQRIAPIVPLMPTTHEGIPFTDWTIDEPATNPADPGRLAEEFLHHSAYVPQGEALPATPAEQPAMRRDAPDRIDAAIGEVIDETPTLPAARPAQDSPAPTPSPARAEDNEATSVQMADAGQHPEAVAIRAVELSATTAESQPKSPEAQPDVEDAPLSAEPVPAEPLDPPTPAEPTNVIWVRFRPDEGDFSLSSTVEGTWPLGSFEIVEIAVAPDGSDGVPSAPSDALSPALDGLADQVLTFLTDQFDFDRSGDLEVVFVPFDPLVQAPWPPLQEVEIAGTLVVETEFGPLDLPDDAFLFA